MRAFKQVDVFSSLRYGGNPVAVVLEAEGLSKEEMQRFAAWTNLSETTFVFPPKSPEADYALRIFTNTRELPFAGHPTLGSCHAWLEHGGVPHDSTGKFIVQECAHGLIRIRRDEHRQRKGGAEKINVTLAFRAPPLSRKGPLEKTELASITTALGLEPSDVLGHSWCVNGPEWRGLLLKSSQHVLAVVPNQALLGDRDVGIIGPRVRNTDTEGSSTENISEENDHFDYEVRAFCPLDNPFEDPATGSLNAGLAQWLLAEGRIGQRNNAGIGEGAGEREGSYSYVVRQGSAVGRQGQIRVMVEDSSGSSDGREDGGGAPDVWIGGACTTCISGMASFDSSKL